MINKSKCIALGMALMLALAACSSPAAAGSSETGSTSGVEKLFNAGTYVGVGKGNNGDIKIEVTTDEEKILSVGVQEHKETPSISDGPIKSIPEKIVEGQTLNVDVIAGATNTSRAILEGATDALKQAGADIAALQSKGAADTGAVKAEDTKTEVVVVGAGAAGMTAAIKLADAGKKVILVEKLGLLGGGDTIRVASYFRAGGSKVQEELKIEDGKAEDYYNKVKKESPTINENTAKLLAEKSGPMADWLVEIGVPFGDVVKSDHLRLRTADGSAPGPHYVDALGKELVRAGVDVRLDTRAEEIVMTDGAATGIKVKTAQGDYTIEADAVVLATGGFANNKELLGKYAPAWSDRPTTGSPALTGDGMIMAEKVGAKLLSMDLIKTNPVCFESPNGGISLLSSLPYCILVNHEGKRFVDESQAYTTAIAEEMMKQQDQEAYIVFDQTAMNDLKILRGYLDMGYFMSADSIEDLAGQLDVNKENFVSTLKNFQTSFDQGKDNDFGRKMVYRLDQPKFYAARVTPSVQNTAGGIAVDDSARALNTNNEVIKGLYSAGHGTAHCGEGATLSAGMATASFVFGQVVAETVVADLK